MTRGVLVIAYDLTADIRMLDETGDKPIKRSDNRFGQLPGPDNLEVPPGGFEMKMSNKLGCSVHAQPPNLLAGPQNIAMLCWTQIKRR